MSAFHRAPLALKVVVALTGALLPLGVLATYLTALAFRATVAHDGHAGLHHWAGLVLPATMWLAALLIGWLVANRLLVAPLMGIRAALDRYSAGDTDVRLGGHDFLSVEMAALAAAFDRMADEVAAHQAAMTGAIDEQRRLTREVHHRVKNNLQIVSSLLSIQARETTDAQVARAYSTVQARVGALALVHRWMYDDEAARGVDLRALATDLCASLEQSITATEGVTPHLRCEVERFVVGQDIAVPLAFLITELVSLAARGSAPAAAEIKVRASTDGDQATLVVSAKVFCDDLTANAQDAGVRIVTGLARQMRAPLRHDPGDCTYSIAFRVPPQRPNGSVTPARG